MSLLLIHICFAAAGCSEAFDYVWSNDIEHVFCYFHMRLKLIQIYTVIHLYVNGITRYKYLVTIVHYKNGRLQDVHHTPGRNTFILLLSGQSAANRIEIM